MNHYYSLGFLSYNLFKQACFIKMCFPLCCLFFMFRNIFEVPHIIGTSNSAIRSQEKFLFFLKIFLNILVAIILAYFFQIISKLLTLLFRFQTWIVFLTGFLHPKYFSRCTLNQDVILVSVFSSRTKELPLWAHQGFILPEVLPLTWHQRSWD